MTFSVTNSKQPFKMFAIDPRHFCVFPSPFLKSKWQTSTRNKIYSPNTSVSITCAKCLSHHKHLDSICTFSLTHAAALQQENH